MSGICRDSVSAWRGLGEIGGLEIDGRDEDLVSQLKDELDPGAKDLESALSKVSIGSFLQALFQVIQPFALMFRDVLTFFERAGAREGKTQWRVSVGTEVLEFRHFEEFLEHFGSLECEIEVPAIDWEGAWIFNRVRGDFAGYEYLDKTDSRLADIEHWLNEYDQGRYGVFPKSLSPENCEPGICDAAGIVLAALSVLRRRGFDRTRLLDEHRRRSYRSVKSDGLHLWSIAQNETDLWLRNSVRFLGNLLTRPEIERIEFGRKLVDAYSKFPRRRILANVPTSELERLLSFPAWKRRHELYGVWVATQIVEALDGHEIKICHANGELKFAFAEAKIAEVLTSRPNLALFSERWTALNAPVGKSRTSGVQPDFGFWTVNPANAECVIIVEVKHYLRRSKRNFRDVLIDYSSAHPRARVALVNYGPVGEDFNDMPKPIRDRCAMFGFMNHGNVLARDQFRKLIRDCVGEPVDTRSYAEQASSANLVVVDSSASMSEILGGAWFKAFIQDVGNPSTKFALIDDKLREIVGKEALLNWLESNALGGSTSLSVPISSLLHNHERIIIVTDQGGLDSMRAIGAELIEHKVDEDLNVRLIHVRQSRISATI